MSAGVALGGLLPGVSATALVDAQNPWPGLASFREVDEVFFKGRGGEIDELRHAVESQRLTVVFGASGLGKTSLLQAGLFPRLREDDELPVSIRLDWSRSVASPMEQVFAELWRLAAARSVEAPERRAGETLWELLHRRDAGFWSERNRLLTPVIVLDQFEEAFSSGREQEGWADHLRGFAEELADLVEGRPPAALRARVDADPAAASAYDFTRHRYRVILSLREDYLAELEGLREIMPSIARGRFRLQPMNGEQALEVVDQTRGRLIERGVAEQVVRFAAGTDLDDARVPLRELSVDPSLLSLFCRELNNRRQHDGLEKITVELVRSNQGNVLEDFYEECMRLVAPATRRFVEDELLTSSGQRGSREYDDVVLRPGVTVEDVARLVDARLLRTEERGGVRRVELTHDVLTRVARASRDRRRQRERVEADQAAERERLEAAQAAERQRLERERDQQVAEKERQRADKEAELARVERQRAEEKSRAVKWFRSLAGVLAVATAAAIWFAWSARTETYRARQEKEAAQSALAESQRAANTALNAVIDLLRKQGGSGQTYQELRDQAETILAGAQRQTAAATAPSATPSSPPTPSPPAPTPAPSPAAPFPAPLPPPPADAPSKSLPSPSSKPRVYIQVQTDAARAGAQKIIPALQAKNFAVPGIELLRVGPRRTEVRYFHTTDQADAESVAAILRAQNVPDVTLKLVPGQEANVRQKQLEIWFAADAFG